MTKIGKYFVFIVNFIIMKSKENFQLLSGTGNFLVLLLENTGQRFSLGKFLITIN